MPPRPGFWRVVLLLLGWSRRRAAGRRQRARQVFRGRAGERATNWGGFGFLLTIAFMTAVNVAGFVLVGGAVRAGQVAAAEARGEIGVSPAFLDEVELARLPPLLPDSPWHHEPTRPPPDFAAEAARDAASRGGDAADIAARLRRAYDDPAHTRFVLDREAAPGLAGLGPARGLPAMLGSLALLWWALVLVLQGEGPELDVQRRRHPMWEWLLSHPVGAGPVFFAEMLAPLAANPLFWSAPLVPGVLYGTVYGAPAGVLAALLLGLPLALAASCAGKALEIGLLLGVRARTRGAAFGLLGWLGSIATSATVLGALFVGTEAAPVVAALQRLPGLPWPWLGWFLGQAEDGSFSFGRGLAAGWALSGAAIAGSVTLAVRAARSGLSAPSDPLSGGPSRLLRRPARFGGDPLYRKELLWLARDRGALVQAVLIPATIAAGQWFNLRGLVAGSEHDSARWCAGALLFGTYFLGVLGPKSLASEGPALWLALTWPRGLESLLLAKARLWTLLASVVVGSILLYAAWQAPADSGTMLAAFGLWLVFARSMAAKAVTLATVATESGATEKVPWGRRWAVYLGALTFTIGVATRQWPTAIFGVAYSTMTATAMWQDFRARLPYLYDPWSARLPAPPTLVHAVVAISLLVDLATVLNAVTLAWAGPDAVAVARTVGYGVAAVIVALGFAEFLATRGARLSDVWVWPGAQARRNLWRHLYTLPLGSAIGAALGLAAIGYLHVLHGLSWAAPLLGQAEAPMRTIQHASAATFVLAVLLAPVAEETLFRGVLFKALDREWRGWRAVAGSALFFAVYHPFLAWLPVGALGACCAVLFRRTGSLAPSVALHMAYNAVVLS